MPAADHGTARLVFRLAQVQVAEFACESHRRKYKWNARISGGEGGGGEGGGGEGGGGEDGEGGGGEGGGEGGGGLGGIVATH